MKLEALKTKQKEILNEIAQIPDIERGTLCEQFFTVNRCGKTVKQGPYYVLQKRLNGKNCSKRIPREQLPPIKDAVQGYQDFKILADKYVDVSEKITLLGRESGSKKKPNIYKRKV